MTHWFAAVALLVLAVAPLVRASGADGIRPTNLESVNTDADEDDPCLTPDGSTLYYASNRGGTFDILLARRTARGWSAGRPLAVLNTKDADERSPFVARDLKFYYATNVIPDEKFKDLKNFDLKVKTGMRAPLILPGISESDDELYPWVTAGGKEFYFSRKTKDGWLLFVARGPALGAVGDAKPAGLPPDFHHATVSTDGKTMYLQGPLEKGRWGLFRSVRGRAGAAWSKPKPLTTLNHADGPRGDRSPCLSADGTRLYFASDRPGGKGGLDLWVVPTAALKPGELQE
ncbi:MAG: PD40 domain-containing protein [Gemmataceae bacterium]|nr:PD40 domain-containing protein [Gemmataceae bacterium]